MSKTLSRKEFNTAISALAREAGTYPQLIARWGDLDRTKSPKAALKALRLVADVKASQPAKVTRKAPKAKPAKARKSTEPRHDTVSVVNGQVRVITREAGKIVANRAATKAEAKAAGLKGTKPASKPVTAPKGKKAAPKTSGKVFLRQKTREAYIKAAQKQDPEYLDAIREFYGIEGNPSTIQCAFYALNPHVGLKVPGFKIGEGYRDMFAETLEAANKA